jgi:hypothetical protein
MRVADNILLRNGIVDVRMRMTRAKQSIGSISFIIDGGMLNSVLKMLSKAEMITITDPSASANR